LPKFSEHSNYYFWRSQFNVLVEEKPWSDQEKMLRLLSCLEGEPKMILSSYTPTGYAYNIAMNRLELEYGGKRRLIRQTINALRQGKIVESHNSKALKMFLSQIETAICVFEENGLSQELQSGSSLIECAKDRLDKDLLSQYLRYTRREETSESFFNLRQCVQLLLGKN